MGGDAHRQVAQVQFGIDQRAFPMSLQAVHDHPVHPVVLEGPGGEADPSGDRVAPTSDHAVDAAIDLLLRAGVIAVAHFGADDVDEFQSLAAHGFGHHIGGLLLFVVLSAVGHGGTVVEVDRPIRAIVEMPELLLVPGRLEGFVLKNFQEVRRLGKARPGGRRRPEAGVMHRQVPAGRSPQRKAAHHQTVLVNGIVPADIVERLEDIRLAGEFVAVTVAAVAVEHEGVRWRKFTGRPLPAVDEVEFAQRLAAPVKPKVQPVRASRAGVVGRRHNQPIRLHRAIDPGNVGAHDQTRGRSPGRLAVAQGLCSLQALLQQDARNGRFIGLEELVILERPLDGFVINLHIRQQFEQPGLAP